VSLVRESGCIGALTAEPGYFSPEQKYADVYRIPRFSMPDNMFDFKQCVFYVERLKDRFRHRAGGCPV
jgi:hypothetical protein